MDALYLESENADIARNLIIASSRELEYHTQRDKQPRADCDTGEGGPTHGATQWVSPPMKMLTRSSFSKQRGRSCYVQMTQKPGKTPLSSSRIGAGDSVRLRPILPSERQSRVSNWLAPSWINLLLFGIATGNGLLIVFSVLSRKEPTTEGGAGRLQLWARIVLLAQIFIAAGLGLILTWRLAFHWATGRRSVLFGENLSWTSGTSIWPTILIRAAAFVLAVILMWIASRNVDRALRELQERLKPVIGEANVFYNISMWAKLIGVWNGRIRGKDQKRCYKNFDVLLRLHWTPVEANGEDWRSCGCHTSLFSGLLFKQFPSLGPGRGTWVSLCERVALAFGVGLYIAHLLDRLDLHVTGFVFLRGLGQYFESKDSDATIEEQSYEILELAGGFTAAAGQTLLYPLTVLVLIMLSRMRLFDAWSMTPRHFG